MQVRTAQLKQRFQQQIEQNRHAYEELIKTKFEKRKITMGTIVDKKDLHYMLNSFLKGDVFEEDLFNQFWISHFKQTATIADVVRAYINGIMYVLDKIVESNIKVFELGKDRQKYKQSHDFKLLNQANLMIEQLNVDLNQYANDLAELSKPFDIDLTPLILKYKPYKMASDEDEHLHEEKLKMLGGVFDSLRQEESQEDKERLKQIEQLGTQEKYYRFVIYVAIVASIGDISLSFSKYNFIDLLSNLLLLLNSLFEYYLLKDDPFFQKIGYLSINYVQGKIQVEQTQHMTTFNPNPLIKQQPRVHSFQRYTYSSLYLMIVAVLIDLLWILLLREPFYFSSGANNPLILSESMWKYNHYVVYASVVMLIFKIVIILLLSMIVELQCAKVLSRYHFIMNFIRFTNLEFLTELVKPNTNA